MKTLALINAFSVINEHRSLLIILVEAAAIVFFAWRWWAGSKSVPSDQISGASPSENMAGPRHEAAGQIANDADELTRAVKDSGTTPKVDSHDDRQRVGSHGALQEIRHKFRDVRTELAQVKNQTAASSIKLDANFHQLHRELVSLRNYVRALSEKPGQGESIEAQLRRLLKEEADQRREDDARKQREEHERIEQDRRDKRNALRNQIATRLDAGSKSNIFRVSALTEELLSKLKAAAGNSSHLEKNFARYLDVATKADELSSKLNSFDTLPQHYLDDPRHGIEMELELFEESLESLAKTHRVVWFTSLLEEACRYAVLESQADALRELLNLELVEVVPGTTPLELQDFEVVSADGMGRNSIISEVLENGYRSTESGALVKKPKVRVRLQD